MEIAEMIVNFRETTMQYVNMLDNAGEGVVKITKGKCTNKQAYLDEMGRFLLYIAYGNGRLKEPQDSIYNLSQSMFSNKSIAELEEMAKNIETLNGGDSLILKGYKQAGVLQAIVHPFDFMGKVMIAFDENPASQERYDKYMCEMRAACNPAPKEPTRTKDTTTELDSQQQIEKWGVGRKDPYVKSVENAGEKLEFPLKVGKTTVTGIADKFEVKGNIHDPRKLIEEVIIPEGYLYIGERAFSDFSNLKKITLPSSLTCIGESAFQGCKNLESITIPASVKKIGEWAFAYCKALKSIEIEDGVEVIDSAAFYECEKLTEVVIPQSVISIKSSVFHDCLRLKNITIPESTQLDCSSTFKGCKKLADKSGMVIIHNILYDYIGQEDAVIIPQGVTDIGSSAFHSNKTLKSITIPDSVTTIGPCAFQWCSSLREIIIPKGVKTIYHYTFCNCLSLKSIVIPEGVTKVGENAFSGCSMLKTIDLPKSVQVVGSCAFSSQYSPTSNMTIIARNPNIEMHKKCFEGCKKYTIYAPEGSSVSQIFPSRTKPLQEYDNK